MNFIALVTARSGSKSVVDKNIQELGGKSLIEWAVRAGLSASRIAEVYISTDSQMYADIAKDAGAIVPFLRPAEYATDLATDSDVFHHFVSNLPRGKGSMGIVHLRPTSPFRDPVQIDEALSIYEAHRNQVTSLRSVQEMPESAYKSFELDDRRFLKPLASVGTMDLANLPRQKFPVTYSANGYVDVINPSSFMSTGSFHGEKVLAFETHSIIEVDSARELELLDFELRADPTIYSRVFGGHNA
jgi:N-acylneuraminate cytidylyltransferase